ncbi:MAG: MaoC family dehydratase N-terminal domain-containing protein [Rhodospirillaceae bacterium]|nr:MaoC family dehydratase N-terminal domain-containing protein [Rhodospirillaceae bacterium]
MTSGLDSQAADHLRSWIGRTETVRDEIVAAQVAAMSATIDRDDPLPQVGDPLPPLWHWLFFMPRMRRSLLGRDGHPALGGFLPPVPLPRRMWAGGRLTWMAPLAVGRAAEKHSTVTDVQVKQGKTGPLVFVTVRHDLSQDGVACLTEEHDIVYRDYDAPGAAKPKPGLAALVPEFSRDVVPDSVLLFRYSALTFNGHRIHYDRAFCTEEEGYPGLVFHGPLTATLLVDLVRNAFPARTLASFSFRAVSPLFDTAPFSIHGCKTPQSDDGAYTLWAQNSEGRLAMQAEVRFAA